MEFRLSAHSIDVSATGSKETTMLKQKALFPVLSILALLPAFLAACGGYCTTGNPAPTNSSLSPTSSFAGGAAFTLTVNGTGFIAGSTVQWKGSNRRTMFVSATQLTATIMAAAWIGDQAQYWLFLRHQTEPIGKEYWRMCLLISRNRTKLREDITRTAGDDCGNSTMSRRLYPSSHSIAPWGDSIEFVEAK
jgi:hypothetical protein